MTPSPTSPLTIHGPAVFMRAHGAWLIHVFPSFTAAQRFAHAYHAHAPDVHLFLAHLPTLTIVDASTLPLKGMPNANN